MGAQENFNAVARRRLEADMAERRFSGGTMPYIAQKNRPPIDAAIKAMPPLKSAGDFNYAVTQLARHFMAGMKEARGRLGYIELNEVVGALESAKLEFYRRIVGPYEDKKIAENGDVYGAAAKGE